MDLNTTLRFPADPGTVFEMLVDPDYVGRKAAAANAIRHEVSVQRDGDSAKIWLLRVMPPDVPDFVRRFVGDTIDLEQTDVWGPAASDGSRDGTISIDMREAPVRLRGTMILVPDGRATRTEVSGTIKASIPLIGGKVESAVHDALILAASREEEVGRQWLAG